MFLDKKHKRVNFLAKRLTHLQNHEMEINFLLDLFDAGYHNAYVSTINFFSVHNNFYHRIEIVLPNVGRLYLYQSFDETLDEQIPHFDVFYTNAAHPNIRTKIQSRAFAERAVRIIYKAKSYFESHPEYVANNNDLIKRIKTNEIFARKQYMLDIKRLHFLVKNFGQEK